MANLNWWETFTANDCYTYDTWNDLIDYIQHSACTAFTIHSTCTSTGQAFLFTQLAVDESDMYGGSTGGDDLKIFANSSDTYPYLHLVGAGEILVYTDSFIRFYQDAEPMFKFDMTPTFAKLYGSEDSGDDLGIYANSTDTYPYILLNGNNQIYLYSTNDIYFYEQTAQMFKFMLSGTDSFIYGGGDSGDNMYILANSADGTPYMKLEGLNNIYIYTANQIWFYKGADKMIQFVFSSPTSFIYGSDDANGNLKLIANSSDSYASLTIYGGVNKIDHHCNEAINFRLENRTSNPSSPTCTGQIWLRTDLGEIHFYDGSSIQVITSA